MPKNKWTDNDCNKLLQNYSVLSKEELLELFPDRSWSSIVTKACKLNIVRREPWSEYENNLLISVYENTDINDVFNMFPNRTPNAIKLRAEKLGLSSPNCIIWTDEQLQFIKDNWMILSDYDMGKKLGKTKNAVKRQRNLLGLHRQDKTQQTYENISKYIRGNIYQWKKDSMKQCQYCCVLTGSKDFEIHHLYPVNKLINSIFINNNIEYKNFNDYTQNELNNILKLFIIEQNKYPLGECVRKDIHSLFHRLYGQYNTTIEQWKQFKNDYINGVYKNYNNINTVA